MVEVFVAGDNWPRIIQFSDSSVDAKAIAQNINESSNADDLPWQVTDAIYESFAVPVIGNYNLRTRAVRPH
jgi:hypothetical protein